MRARQAEALKLTKRDIERYVRKHGTNPVPRPMKGDAPRTTQPDYPVRARNFRLWQEAYDYGERTLTQHGKQR